MATRRLTKLGSRFVIGGALALIAPWLRGVSVTVLIGMILIGSGITFIILALDAQTGGKGRSPLLLGLVAAVTGACLLIWPGMTTVTLTALLATFLALSGFLTLAFAVDLQPVRGRFWFHLAGAVALLLAVSMWYQFPLFGSVAVGSLVGFNLLMMGGSLIGLRAFETPAQTDTDMSI